MAKILNLFNNSYLPLLLVTIAGCATQVEKPTEIPPNKFHDSLMVLIYDYQDKRETNNLLKYFNHENAAYQEAAAEAFGSVQDSLAIPMLGHLLNDSSLKVRKAAAYALGQSYDSGAIKYLAQALQYEDSVFVRRELLEALGKVVTQPRIQLLYNQTDETVKEKEGLAWGLYRAGIRNVHDAIAVKTGVSLLDSSNSYETRLGAAHFLARSKGLELASYEAEIIKSATHDISPGIRMASATALQKIPTARTREVLENLALKDTDYRVRVNAIRSLSAFDYAEIKSAAFHALDDDNVNVTIAAANLIDSKAEPEEAAFIIENALKHKDPRTKASLLGTGLKLTDNKIAVIDQIKLLYSESEDPYFKAELLSALGNALQSYEFLITKMYSEEHPAIATAGISALIHLRSRDDFPAELKPAFADVFEQAILSKDIAMVALTSDLLGNSKYNFKEEFDSIAFLYEAKKHLSLPKDNEALQSLNRAIAYFNGSEDVPEVKNEYNHPIDWGLVKALPKAQKVLVKTEKGDIELRLLVEEAPGSVANFVSLAQKGYFQGKNIHRVVSNFVIQGGCNRGDGYGGEDYSIRSELANLRYAEGAVGMASAGKDTEGTQWFITHSPTPHLDGRYTIFAQVTDGMEVVHSMEVGDSIQSIELIR